MLKKITSQNFDSPFPYQTLFGMIIFGLWILIGFFSNPSKKEQLKLTTILHIPAGIFSFFLLYQEIILEQYLQHKIGLFPHLFFFPLFKISVSLANLLLVFTPYTATVGFSSFIALLLLVLFWYVGTYFRKLFLM